MTYQEREGGLLTIDWSAVDGGYHMSEECIYFYVFF